MYREMLRARKSFRRYVWSVFAAVGTNCSTVSTGSRRYVQKAANTKTFMS
jgi:hypothetical protein